MYPNKFELYPEVKFLEKVIRRDLREKGMEGRIPRMDRLIDNYKLLLSQEGERKIDMSLAKELGVAVLLHAAGMTASESKSFLAGYEISGMESEAKKEIVFAVNDCLHIRKSYTRNVREAESQKAVVRSLLSLLIHMDELGEEDFGLFAVIERRMAEDGPLDLYGNIPAAELRDMIAYKMLRDKTQERLEKDGSVIAAAILLILRTRYFIAPVESFLNTDTLMEVKTRRMWLRTETERLIRRKMKNEKSLEL